MMNRLLASALALFGMTAAAPTVATAESQTTGAEAKAKTTTVNIPVKGMACQQMCGTRVHKALKAIDGVETVVVSAAENNARITYVEGKVGPERFVEVVKELGFEAGAPKPAK
ncbi:MAG: heavy-metal-associated domain-containing protein [Acidobacteria bacterium]|nr:heavy-metal-associated domain-containing protein [Acidobacteriota bacterium]